MAEIQSRQSVKNALPAGTKSDQNQVVENILIFGMKGYGKYARHLYTYTWADEETKKKREEELEAGKEVTRLSRFQWKVKCFVRSPKIIAYFDKRRGTKAEKLYTFFAYDFLDDGPVYYFKKLVRKIFR